MSGQADTYGLIAKAQLTIVQRPAPRLTCVKLQPSLRHKVSCRLRLLLATCLNSGVSKESTFPAVSGYVSGGESYALGELSTGHDQRGDFGCGSFLTSFGEENEEQIGIIGNNCGFLASFAGVCGEQLLLCGEIVNRHCHLWTISKFGQLPRGLGKIARPWPPEGSERFRLLF